MRYFSTRGQSAPVSLAAAVRAGTASDGGLYLPERLPPLEPDRIASFRTSDLPTIAAAVLEPFLAADLSPAQIHELTSAALDFPIPLVTLDRRLHVLELFHGPTLAFKDVAARFLARLLVLLRDGEGEITVLVATSGDTGGAVAEAFHGVEGTRVVVLYPLGRVSELQERQFAALGGNVRALAVRGSFDDCQDLAKRAFADPEITRRVELVSANSINIGRLLPQMAYWFHAVARLEAGAPPPMVAVPSGNFGNLTSGLLARRLGLEATLVAATNLNDAVPRFLVTGRFAPSSAIATLSTAMDVGRPSNFERILALCAHRPEAVSRELLAHVVDDGETRAAMVDLDRRFGYLIDPHGAVGWAALERALAGAPPDAPGIVLATAHPAKFPRRVEAAVGRRAPVPVTLHALLERPLERCEIQPRLAALRRHLLET